MLITLAGHVDHGKSAIVKALTGTDPDRLEEEQRRGLTIDLGFAYTDFNGVRLGFVDVPGHHKFIHNMIAGVAKKQHALVVIAADDGIMPQTKEHVNILELLDLQRGTVALSKVDRVENNDLNKVKMQVQQFIKNTFLSKAKIVEVSIPEQRGLDQLVKTIVNVEQHAEVQTPKRSIRLAIDRAFSPKGEGTVVTGMLIDGYLSVGDVLVIPRSGKQVRVKKIVANGVEAHNARVGDRCGLQLTGEKVTNIFRGDWLRDPECNFTSKQFTVQFRVLNDFPRTIQHWTPVHLYHGTFHSEGRILPLQHSLTAGDLGLVDIQCHASLSMALGDRVIVRDRDQSRTIGGGQIVSVIAPSTRRRLTTRLENLSKLTEYVSQENVQGAIESVCRENCVKIRELGQSWNLNASKFTTHLDQQNVAILNERLLSQDKLRDVQNQIYQFLKNFHQQHPTLIGASTNEIWRAMSNDIETIRFVLEHSVLNGRFSVNSGKYSLSTHTATAPNYNQSLYQQVLCYVDVVQPLTIGDIARELRIPNKSLEMEMQRFVVAKLLIKVSPKRYYTLKRLKELAIVVDELATHRPFTVQEFRDASKMGRMAGIEVLEYFDQIRFTRRDEDVRRIIGTFDKTT
ncbi:MAG: selenocysteine-specific translation elongation factor [Gammaproteobacteria bacterium]|nr:selenocysteine-specific translation elongation factor [Gammaproteobacteria bacterium]MXX95097.1 selenocysteine-specific translation elongation factor [Gammaproteobacteria bacterium]MYF52227.1 selenocysteine-specific translation elongation factor [Gammaproteobacteria bacterium]MYK42958.1 selenocysteine-specific translation elongation factor [Gammaproteobacteria bacterium]